MWLLRAVLQKQSLLKLLGIAMTVALLNTACNDAGSDAADKPEAGKAGVDSIAAPVVPVRVVPVERGPISNAILTTTTIQADRNARIFSRTTAVIQEILVQEGAYVKKGQALAVLEHDELEAALAKVEAVLNAREQELKRAKSMLKSELFSQEEYDTKQQQYLMARADWQSAKVAYDQTTITAPFRGTITERHLNVGNMARPGEALFTLVDLNALLIHTFLPEVEWGRIKHGLQVKLETDALPDGAFSGNILRVNPVIDPQNGTFKVTIGIKDSSRRLKPGMFVRVKILTDLHQEALLIPKIALLEDDEVFTVIDSLATKIKLSVGLKDAEFAEILEGAKPGDLIVIAGHRSMKDSTKVKIITE